LRHVVVCKLGQSVGDVLHERTMVAHEDDQKRRLVVEIVQPYEAAIDIHQLEIRRRRAELLHRAGGFYHGDSSLTAIISIESCRQLSGRGIKVLCTQYQALSL